MKYILLMLLLIACNQKEKRHEQKPITVNIKWFGARGDGITNDSAAFANALKYLEENNGGALYCPQGVYKTSTVYPSIYLEQIGDKLPNKPWYIGGGFPIGDGDSSSWAIRTANFKQKFVGDGEPESKYPQWIEFDDYDSNYNQFDTAGFKIVYDNVYDDLLLHNYGIDSIIRCGQNMAVDSIIYFK